MGKESDQQSYWDFDKNAVLVQGDKEGGFLCADNRTKNSPTQSLINQGCQEYETRDPDRIRTERAEQLVWLHERGLVVALPPESSRRITMDTVRGRCLSPLESTRLRILNSDPIVTLRCPSEDYGVRYMGKVDPVSRETIYYPLAEKLSNGIVNAVKSMGKVSAHNPNEAEVAVLLFGSVAKCLSRNVADKDPSNLDIVVIGEFDDEEKHELFTRVSKVRADVRKELLSYNPSSRITPDMANAGVHIQRSEQFRKGDYGWAIQMIGSSARALYDPLGIWKTIEDEALATVCVKETSVLDHDRKQMERKWLFNSWKSVGQSASARCVQVKGRVDPTGTWEYLKGLIDINPHMSEVISRASRCIPLVVQETIFGWGVHRPTQKTPVLQ